jgi:hypothetical protein
MFRTARHHWVIHGARLPHFRIIEREDGLEIGLQGSANVVDSET